MQVLLEPTALMSQHPAELDYRQPETLPPPGPIAQWWLAPLPYWFWCAVLCSPMLLAHIVQGGWFNPESYYLFPLTQLVFIVPVVVAWVMFRTIVRHMVAARHGISADGLHAERGRVAVAIALVGALIAIGPVLLSLGVMVRWNALESLRMKVEIGAAPAGPISVPPFRFTDSEVYRQGIVILYTEASRGAFPGRGSGLIHLPKSVRFPPYNEGSHGRLVGGWYWFTTD